MSIGLFLTADLIFVSVLCINKSKIRISHKQLVLVNGAPSLGGSFFLGRCLIPTNFKHELHELLNTDYMDLKHGLRELLHTDYTDY